jgi:hypothetical protein
VFNEAGFVTSSNAALVIVNPVTFTVHPANQNVQPGTNVTLTATAVGTGTVRYQWRYEGTNILNATNSSYSFTNATFAEHGNYSVVARDDISVATSSNAFIFVLVKPGIVTHITSLTVLQGRSATFSLVATGAPPLGYRWIRNSGSIPGATTSVPVLVITNVQASGTMRVAVTNVASPGGVFSPGPLAGNNVQLIMLPDADGDGVADAWETQYGFSTTNAADALLDFDGDGMSNQDEYISGTNPTNALSVLKVVFSAVNPVELNFIAQSNISYTVQWNSNLTAPVWSNLTSITSQPLVRTVVVDTATTPPLPERYYRVVTPLVP